MGEPYIILIAKGIIIITGCLIQEHEKTPDSAQIVAPDDPDRMGSGKIIEHAFCFGKMGAIIPNQEMPCHEFLTFNTFQKFLQEYRTIIG